MNERSIFMEALERDSATHRSSFLDEACAGDTALRQRVEALLQSHESAGEFMGRPAPERLVQELNNTDKVGETRAEDAPADDSDALGFLTPSDKPGVLGRMDHYEILDIVGRGGMGVVLRAFDETLHRVVAIKVMAAQLASSDPARKRFTREAQAAAAVSHDHIVTIHAVEHGPSPYMVMQYVPGVSLQQRLDREGPLPLEDIVRIGMQTASGLAAAHALGLIHRDIKPANILLEKGADRVKITDFGMARAAADASLTRTGVVTGTPQYMAPEQARAGQLDARTDLFSLGSVLYAMCTGRPPFRAQGSLAILKRVCEEAPSPIRDTNPEIPEWLVAIIEKLQAKDPAQRYQSAAEVVELLNGHLTQLTLTPYPSPSGRGAEGTPYPSPSGRGAEGTPYPSPSGRGARGEGVSAGKAPDTAITTRNSATGLQPPVGKRRRWRLAAACVLLLVGGLFLEAAGVTDLQGTVLRIFTPDGTLIVDDPGVKVTVEDDDGLVITGVGLEEIRLRPGSYRVQANKNGKPVPLEKDWVSIATGGREVLKVKLEAVATVTAALPKTVTAAPPMVPSAQVATGPFVLLAAGKDYATLAEAVQHADDRETIEIRGNGPFVSEPIIVNKAMVIRAGEGFRPVIKASPAGIQSDKPLIHTNAALVLEGLELHRPLPKDSKTGGRHVVQTFKASLRAANCRFRGHFWMNQSPVCVFRNCEILADAGHISGWYRSGARLLFENCLHRTKGAALSLDFGKTETRDVWIQIKRGTFVSNGQPLWLSLRSPLPDPSEATAKPFHVDVSESIFDGHAVLGFLAPLEPGESESTLARLLSWHGERNLFGGGSACVKWWSALGEKPSSLGPKDLEGWKQFWKSAETGSLEGGLKFTEGDLRSPTGKALDQLTPEDFRLLPDSTGYRAGKDDKDLGADVDLVGPGPAYKRWKKTSDYQLWLKETGQNSTMASEAKAFVLLGAKGREVRRFDTLYDAVNSAFAGDTIEVRGNGPFVTEPITIQKALTIRAGDGFWPVIKADPEEQSPKLLHSSAALVLEGLEFQWVDAKPFEASPGGARLVVSGGPKSRLQAANCRFIMNRREGAHNGMACLNAWDTPLCHLRNCQFLIGGRGTINGNALGIRGAPDSELVFDNCLKVGRGDYVELTHEKAMKAVLNRNTFLGPTHATLNLALCKKIDLKNGDPRPFQIESSANIFEGRIQFSQSSIDVERLTASEAEQFLKRLIGWRENRNVYLLPDEAEFLRLSSSPSPGEYKPMALTVSRKTVADWNNFRSMKETDSQRGKAQFLGGDLIAKAKQTPEQLLPSDFQLAPGSAGYRAGTDGKDLGADVDLVGPGPAYERWKKTPEYQQWLKETRQSMAPRP